MTTPLVLRRVALDGTVSAFRTIEPPPLGLKAVDAVLLSRDGALHAYSYGQELSQLFLMELGAREVAARG